MPCERQKQALEVKFLSRASRGNTGSGSCESPLSSNSMFHSLFTFLTVSKTEILNIMNPKLVKSKIVRKQKSGVLRQHVIVMRQNRTLPKKSALRLTLRSLRSHRTIKDGFPDRSAFWVIAPITTRRNSSSVAIAAQEPLINWRRPRKNPTEIPRKQRL